MSAPPFLVLVGCYSCHGHGRRGIGGEYTVPCDACSEAGTWLVDLEEEIGGDPTRFLDFYGHEGGMFLQDQGEHVTEYACLHGFTWHEVGQTAPAWLELPEGPSRAEFEEERAALRERAPLAKTYPSAVEAKRSA